MHLIFFVLVSFSLLVEAGFNEGVEAFEKGDYEGAYRHFVPLAYNRVDMASKCYLAAMAEENHDIEDDVVRYITNDESASRLANSFRKALMGKLYLMGRLQTEDNSQKMGLKKLLSASVDESPFAYYLLGCVYLGKLGNQKKDPDEATKYLEKAVEKTHHKKAKALLDRLQQESRAAWERFQVEHEQRNDLPPPAQKPEFDSVALEKERASATSSVLTGFKERGSVYMQDRRELESQISRMTLTSRHSSGTVQQIPPPPQVNVGNERVQMQPHEDRVPPAILPVVEQPQPPALGANNNGAERPMYPYQAPAMPVLPPLPFANTNMQWYNPGPAMPPKGSRERKAFLASIYGYDVE